MIGVHVYDRSLILSSSHFEHEEFVNGTSGAGGFVITDAADLEQCEHARQELGFDKGKHTDQLLGMVTSPLIDS